MIPLQAGLIGMSNELTIFMTKTTSTSDLLASINGDLPPGIPVASDIRRISYWLGSNGGLCRQEIPWFTSDQFYTMETYVYEDGKSDQDYLIASEVTNVLFEYYNNDTQQDNSGWQEFWDGTQPGPDGVTPMGPPSAVRVTLTLKIKDAHGKDSTKDYQQVIPIITANGPSLNAQTGSSSGQTSQSGSTTGSN